MAKKNPRDHGLGDTNKPLGPPRARPITDAQLKQMLKSAGALACPNCGCPDIMEIEVLVENVLLTHGKGICLYLGCPACPWASPAISRTLPPVPEA